MNARVLSARSLIEERVKGNTAVGSNQAFLKAIGTLTVIGETVSDEAMSLARRLSGDAITAIMNNPNEECEWCGVTVIRCERLQTGEDEDGCPGPELRALRACNARLHNEVVRQHELLSEAVLWLRATKHDDLANRVELQLQQPISTQPATRVVVRANPVSELNEFAMQREMEPPAFSFTQTGPAHMPTIHCTCTFANHSGEAVSQSKRDAKRLAAEKVRDAIVASDRR